MRSVAASFRSAGGNRKGRFSAPRSRGRAGRKPDCAARRICSAGPRRIVVRPVRANSKRRQTETGRESQSWRRVRKIWRGGWKIFALREGGGRKGGRGYRATAAKTARAKELEERLREAIDRNRSASDTLSQADAERNETGRRLADLEARLLLSERTREETIIENGRLLAALADREADLRTALAKTVGKNAPPAAAAAQEDAEPLETQSESPAEAAWREPRHGARADRAIHRENEALSATVAALGASADNASDDAALRDSIERFGRDIIRLYAGQKLAARSDRVPGEPPSPEARGFAEASRRRLARSHASDC